MDSEKGVASETSDGIGVRLRRWWLESKWHVTYSFTRHLSDWRVRRGLNALLVPAYLLKNLRILIDRGLYLPQVGIVTTKRCVLNCDHCVALVPTYRERSVKDLASVDLPKTIDRLLSIVDGASVTLTGGEPLLQPLLPSLFQRLLAAPKVRDVRMFTTGMPQPAEGLVELLKHKKVTVSVSDYGFPTMQKTVATLKAAGVRVRVESADWTDFGPFQPRRRSPDENRRVFQQCWARECQVVLEGKLHHCYRSSHGMDLGLIPPNRSDYADLMAGTVDEARADLRRFLAVKGISACEYCDGAGAVAPRGVQLGIKRKE